MSQPTADELLMGSGAKYFPFLKHGDKVKGTILTKPKTQMQTDIKTGEVVRFPSGDPVWLLIINLQTDLRENADDDGTRSVWAKSGMIKALRDAVIAAGAKGLDAGGELTLEYINDIPPTTRGMDPTKVYQASYVPPSDRMLDLPQGEPEQQQPAAQPAPQQSPPQATPPAQQPRQQPQQAAGNGQLPPPPPGIDASVWANFTPEQRAMLAPAAPSIPPPPPGMEPALWASLSDDQRAMFTDKAPF